MRRVVVVSYVVALIALASIASIANVPAPWTPVQVDTNTLICWNRKYDFAGKLLPASIINGGVRLLSAPMRLNAKVGGVMQMWTTNSFTVTKTDPDAVEATTISETSTLRATCKWRFEFDGMLLCDLTVAPKSGLVTLSSLDLQLPFSSAYAKLFHHHPIKPITQLNWATDTINNGAIPSGGMALPWVHHIWVGDEKRGLQWFAESDQGLAPVGSFINISSSKTMTMSLLGMKVLTTAQPFHWVFGFMASPVKPSAPQDDIRWAFPGGGIGIYNHDYNGTPSSAQNSWLAQLAGKGINCLNLWNAQPMGDPLITNPDLPNLLNAADGYGIGVLGSTGVWIDQHTQGFNTSTWPLNPVLTWADEQTAPGVLAYAMCQRGPWQQWFLDRSAQAVTQQNVDGLYLDGSGCPQICTNTAHGCGYWNGIQTKGTLPILATRELMKQLYLITRSVSGSRKFILAHTSSTVVLPCLSFADASLDGEHINGYPEVNQPLNTYNNTSYTIEGFRAQMIGHQYGIPSFYLKYAKTGLQAEDARRGAAYAVVHGMMSLALDHAPLMWDAYAKFGASSAQWVPYWESVRPITSSSPDIKVSSYVKQGEGVLTVAANLTQSSITTNLAVNRASLGLDDRARMRDLVTGANVSVNADTASVTIGAGSYLLLQTDYSTHVNQNLVNCPANGATATYTCSTSSDAQHTAQFAADGATSTGWASKLEAWKTTPTPPLAWWQVEWTAPQTFNVIEVYIPSTSGYVPNEFVVEAWDSGASAWKELVYGKKTDNALTYTSALATSVTTTKLRYRVLNMTGFSYGTNTQSGLNELKVFNRNPTNWCTITGVVSDSGCKPVSRSHTYIHLTSQPGDLANWDNVHVLGSRSALDGSYTLVIDPASFVGKTGSGKVVVFSNGMSMSTQNPSVATTSEPVKIAVGSVVTCNIALPSPSDASLCLGGGAPGPWLTQSLNIGGTRCETTNTTAGGRVCAQICPAEEMCYYLNPTFADGRFDRMYVDIDYYDQDINGIRLMGAPLPEMYSGSLYIKGASRIRKENSLTWRTQTLVLENSFATGWWLAGNQFGMFSLVPFADGVGSIDKLNDYIGSIRVRFAPEQFVGLPSVTFGMVGSSSDHVALRCKDNGLHPRFAPAVLGSVLGSIGSQGRTYYETTGSRRYLVLDVDNHYAYGPVDSITLRIDYLDRGDAAQSTRVEIMGGDGNPISKNLAYDGHGKWMTAFLTFNVAKLADSYYGCGDILIDDLGKDAAIASVSLIPAPQ